MASPFAFLLMVGLVAALAVGPSQATAVTRRKADVVPPVHGTALTAAQKARSSGRAPMARAMPLRAPDTWALRPGEFLQPRLQPGGAKRSVQGNSPIGRRRGPSASTPDVSISPGLDQEGLDWNGTSPPDTTGAIGPSDYLEFVNSQVGVFARSDLSPEGSTPLSDFVGAAGDRVFHPQVQWDPQAGRWLYLADDVTPTGVNFLAFGWSKTADPTDLAGGWCKFFLHTGPEFDDYPRLGHDDGHLEFGSNVFGGDGAFLTARIWAVAKPPAAATSCNVPAISSFGSAASPLRTADGQRAFTPVPASTGDASPNGYVAAADYQTAGHAPAQIMAWHVSGPGNAPTLTADGNIDVPAYAIPAVAPQPRPWSGLDTLDARLTQAVAHADPGAGGAEAIWTQHTVAGAGGRSVVRWYELIPSTLSVRQEGTVQDPENFIFNAAISPTMDGTSAAIDYNVAGATLLPEIRAASRVAATPPGQMSEPVTLGVSAGLAHGFPCGDTCPWGANAGASPDPTDPSLVWGSNQINEAPDGTWRTRNFALDTRPRADTTPPETSLDSGPSGQGNDATATFTFSADDVDATFECRLDLGAYAPCHSPQTYSALAGGAHTLDVRATDASGNTDLTPATAAWFVGVPPANDDFDDAQTLAAVSTTVTVTGSTTTATSEPGEPDHALVEGGHSIWYRWTASNTGPVTIDTCGSDYDTTLAAYTGTAVASLTNVTGNDDALHGLCNESVQSWIRFDAQAGQTYRLAVDGVVESTAGTGHVTLTLRPPPDVTPPNTMIASGPRTGSTIDDATPSFGFSASEPGTTLRCKIDTQNYSACTSPETIGPLRDGLHAFAVRAIDGAGNADTTPARRTFTVDTTGPGVRIDSGPAAGATTGDATPSFGFSSDEAGSTLQCDVDTGAFKACTSPATLGPLSDGSHAFAVRAIDGLGNITATPARRTFTVDTVTPLARSVVGRLRRGRVHFKRHTTLVLPSIGAGQLPRRTLVVLSLSAGRHKLGATRFRVKDGRSRVVLRLSRRGRRFVKRHRGGRLRAILRIVVTTPNHSTVKGTRKLSLRG